MKAYMGFSREGGCEDWAVLVFAHTAKEARRVAVPVISEFGGGSWIDAAVRLIKDSQYLFAEADQKKLE